MNDGPDVKLSSVGLRLMIAFWMDPPWPNLRFSLALTICES